MSKIMRELQHEARASQQVRPKMRYSVERTDTGYANLMLARVQSGGSPTVYLDGEEVFHVVMADEVLGIVRQAVMPLVVTDDQTFATVEKRGVVEVRWPASAADTKSGP